MILLEVLSLQLRIPVGQNLVICPYRALYAIKWTILVGFVTFLCFFFRFKNLCCVFYSFGGLRYTIYNASKWLGHQSGDTLKKPKAKSTKSFLLRSFCSLCNDPCYSSCKAVKYTCDTVPNSLNDV